VKAATGPGGKPAVTTDRVIELFTHKIGDPKWRGPDGAVLKFQVYTKVERPLTVVLYRKWLEPGNTKFTHEVALKPSDDWQEITLKLSDFRSEKGESPEAWRDVQVLSLNSPGPGGSVPLFTDFRWVKND
jgi:hypothetical protein